MWKLNIEENEQVSKGIYELRKVDAIVNQVELKRELGDTCFVTIIEWVNEKGDVLDFTSPNGQYHLRVEKV